MNNQSNTVKMTEPPSLTPSNGPTQPPSLAPSIAPLLSSTHLLFEHTLNHDKITENNNINDEQNDSENNNNGLLKIFCETELNYKYSTEFVNKHSTRSSISNGKLQFDLWNQLNKEQKENNIVLNEQLFNCKELREDISKYVVRNSLLSLQMNLNLENNNIYCKVTGIDLLFDNIFVENDNECKAYNCLRVYFANEHTNIFTNDCIVNCNQLLSVNEQRILINELKSEINDKQNTIDILIYKSNNICKPKYNNTIKKLKYQNNLLRKEKDDALNGFNNIVNEWQHMENQIDETYNRNELLQKQLKTFEYNYINEYTEYKINNPNTNIQSFTCNKQFENISNQIPNIINKLHNFLMNILTRMDLPNVNDDVVLEQLFGSVDGNTNNKNSNINKLTNLNIKDENVVLFTYCLNFVKYESCI